MEADCSTDGRHPGRIRRLSDLVAVALRRRSGFSLIPVDVLLLEAGFLPSSPTIRQSASGSSAGSFSG